MVGGVSGVGSGGGGRVVAVALGAGGGPLTTVAMGRGLLAGVGGSGVLEGAGSGEAWAAITWFGGSGGGGSSTAAVVKRRERGRTSARPSRSRALVSRMTQ